MSTTEAKTELIIIFTIQTKDIIWAVLAQKKVKFCKEFYMRIFIFPAVGIGEWRTSAKFRTFFSRLDDGGGPRSPNLFTYLIAISLDYAVFSESSVRFIMSFKNRVFPRNAGFV